MTKPVVSKNLNFGRVRHLGFELDGGGLPAPDARPAAPRERDKSVLVPFTHEPFGFESMRVVPIPRYVTLYKPSESEWTRETRRHLRL